MGDQNTYVLLSFLTILNQIKIYHWQTFNYARHKATDDLYSELSGLIDNFVEVLQGRVINKESKNYRIMFNANTTIPISNLFDTDASNFLKNCKKFFENDKDLLSILNTSTDLSNIRDEMLALINKNIYLFSLN